MQSCRHFHFKHSVWISQRRSEHWEEESLFLVIGFESFEPDKDPLKALASEKNKNKKVHVF